MPKCRLVVTVVLGLVCQTRTKMMKTNRTNKTNKAWVRMRLREHLADPDATLNDIEVERLYRLFHDLPEDQDTDLEDVEQWAVRTAQESF